MTKAKITPVCFKVERETFAKGINITGSVWLQVGESGFPDQHWNDFPVIIIGWWLDALTNLWQGNITSCQCLFMDGPYSFTVTRASDLWQVDCFDNHTTPEITEIAALVDPKSFLHSLCSIGGEIVYVCEKRQWQTTDTDYLAKRWAHLNALLNKNGT